MTKKTQEAKKDNLFVAKTDLAISRLNLYLKKGDEITLSEKQIAELKPQIDAGLLGKI